MANGVWLMARGDGVHQPLPSAMTHQPWRRLLYSFADFHAREPRNADAGAQRLVRLRDDVLDLRLRLTDDRLLLEQDDLLVIASELPLDDLVDDVRGLPGVLHLCAVDRALFLDDVGRHPVARHILRTRTRRRDMHRDFADERLELLAIADRGRHAAELHLNAELAADAVDVLADVVSLEAREPRRGHVLAQFCDRRRNALPHGSFRILQPR